MKGFFIWEWEQNARVRAVRGEVELISQSSILHTSPRVELPCGSQCSFLISIRLGISSSSEARALPVS